AGVLSDGMLSEQTPESFERVLSPKVEGAWNLHRLTSGLTLDFFVLFSSAAGLFGAMGQGNYAAANAFLDALAEHRRAHGLPGQSLAWGPWSDVGLASTLPAARKARLSRLGLRTLSPSQGIALLESALGRSEALLGAFLVDLRALSEALG